jgi:Flp pilus assembly protein TadD
MGEIHLMLDEASKAVGCFERSLRSDPERTAAVVGLIRALNRSGRREEAAKRLVALTERQPELDEVLDLAIFIYEPLELLSDAAKLYVALLAAAPERLDLRFRLAWVIHRLGKVDDAATQIDLILDKDPDHEGALYFKGHLLVQADRLEEAEGYLVKSAEKVGIYFTEAINLLHWIAVRFASRYQYERAIQVFDKLLSLDPSHITALSDRALSLAKCGRKQEADAAYEILLKRDAWDSSYVNNYALHLMGTGRTPKGLSMLKRAVEMD